jgi:hypothetical protein
MREKIRSLLLLAVLVVGCSAMMGCPKAEPEYNGIGNDWAAAVLAAMQRKDDLSSLEGVLPESEYSHKWDAPFVMTLFEEIPGNEMGNPSQFTFSDTAIDDVWRGLIVAQMANSVADIQASTRAKFKWNEAIVVRTGFWHRGGQSGLMRIDPHNLTDSDRDSLAHMRPYGVIEIRSEERTLSLFVRIGAKGTHVYVSGPLIMVPLSISEFFSLAKNRPLSAHDRQRIITSLTSLSIGHGGLNLLGFEETQSTGGILDLQFPSAVNPSERDVILAKYQEDGRPSLLVETARNSLVFDGFVSSSKMGISFDYVVGMRPFTQGQIPAGIKVRLSPKCLASIRAGRDDITIGLSSTPFESSVTEFRARRIHTIRGNYRVPWVRVYQLKSKSNRSGRKENDLLLFRERACPSSEDKWWLKSNEK